MEIKLKKFDADYRFKCDKCGEYIEHLEDFYFFGSDKICEDCAEDLQIFYDYLLGSGIKSVDDLLDKYK